MSHSTIATSKKVTLTLPSVNLKALSQAVSTFLSEAYSNVYNPLSSGAQHVSEGASSRARRMRMPRMGKFNFDKKKLKIILPVIIGIVVLAAVVSVVRSLPNAQSKSTETTSQVVAPGSVATIKLDKKFSFPLKDNAGKKVGDFDYVIQSADLQRQIIVQGQRASAVDGRIFLILNLKITNNLEQTIQLNTRDFLRLVVAGNKNEQLAPDIHNDPVEVQAISTKYTRIGIAIDEADAREAIQVKVGEIGGEKQNINLNFDF